MLILLVKLIFNNYMFLISNILILLPLLTLNALFLKTIVVLFNFNEPFDNGKFIASVNNHTVCTASSHGGGYALVESANLLSLFAHPFLQTTQL